MNDQLPPAGPSDPMDDPMLDAVERSIVGPRPFRDAGFASGGDPMPDAVEGSIVGRQPCLDHSLALGSGSILEAVERSVLSPAPAPPGHGPLGDAPIGPFPANDAGFPAAPVPPPEAPARLMDILEDRIEAVQPDAFSPDGDRLSVLLESLEREIESNAASSSAAGPAIESIRQLGEVAKEVEGFLALASPDLMLDIVRQRVTRIAEDHIESRQGSDGDELRKALNHQFAQMKASMDRERQLTSARSRFQSQLIETFGLIINDVLWQIRKDLAAESSRHEAEPTAEHPAFVPQRGASPKANDAPQTRRVKGWPPNPRIDLRRTGSPPRRTFHMPKTSRKRSRYTRPSGQHRYCYDTQDIVPLSQCDSCDKFRDWSDGSQAESRQCLHDWNEEQRAEESHQEDVRGEHIEE